MKPIRKLFPILLAVVLLTGCTSIILRESDLHKAAQAGNAEEVRRLLDTGANVNAVDIANQTPLIYAAYGGHIKAVKLLLEHGAQVNVCDSSFGFTALHAAALYNHEDVVNLLLDSGADINPKSKNHGYTPLFLAAKNGQTNTVRVLLSRGADINIKNNEGVTAFAAAKSEAVAEMIADAPAQRVKASQQQQALLLQSLALDQLLERNNFANEAFVYASTDRLIEAKNKELPVFVMQSTVDQRIALVTTVEKRLSEAQTTVVELTGKAEDAVRKGQDSSGYRRHIGKLQAYMAVLAELKNMLMQS